MAVDYKSPIYLQLREVVRGKIESGEYPPGMAIPSENELSDMYGVNRLTVRNAIDALVKEGLLKRIQGKGAFVVGDRIERDLDWLSGFRQTFTERDADPAAKIHAKTRRPAGRLFASVFGVGEDDDIFYGRRLNSAIGEPGSAEHTYVPASKVPKLDGIDLGVFSLYEVYGFYGVSPVRAYETLDLVSVEARDARMLGVEPGSTVLLFTCWTYDAKDDVVEYTRSYTRGDKCCFTVRIRV